MPHMHLAGRRLLLASDDFVLGSWLGALARVPVVVVLAATASAHSEGLFGQAGGCGALGSYTAASLGVFGALLAHSGAMCRVAGAGGVLQPGARTCVAPVLVAGLVLR